MIPNELILAAGVGIAFALGFLTAALFSARSQSRAYRAGRTDMEKLIRDRAVADKRDNTSARIPFAR